MEIDVVSKAEFEELQDSYKALLHYLKLKEIRCPEATNYGYYSHPKLSNGKSWTCEICEGSCITFEPKFKH